MAMDPPNGCHGHRGSESAVDAVQLLMRSPQMPNETWRHVTRHPRSQWFIIWNISIYCNSGYLILIYIYIYPYNYPYVYIYIPIHPNDWIVSIICLYPIFKDTLHFPCRLGDLDPSPQLDDPRNWCTWLDYGPKDGNINTWMHEWINTCIYFSTCNM